MKQTILQLQSDTLSYEEYMHLKEVCNQWENQFEFFRDLKAIEANEKSRQIDYGEAFFLLILFCIWFYWLNKKQYKLTHTKYNIKPFAWTFLVVLVIFIICAIFLF